MSASDFFECLVNLERPRGTSTTSNNGLTRNAIKEDNMVN